MSSVDQKFIALFKKALSDKEGKKEKSTKQKEKDYYDLNFFINGLKKKDHLQACLDAYLKLYTDYLPQDRRSKFVFAQLLKKRIEVAKPDDKFLSTLSDLIADKQGPFSDPVKLRYEASEDKEQKEIKSILEYKLQLKKQQTSVLDLLKEAYEKEKKEKPDAKTLLLYNPVSDAAFAENFAAVKKDCRIAWENKDAEGIEPALNKYISFLSKETNILRLFQVLKWTRDVVTNQPFKVSTNDRGEVQKITYPNDELDCEFYFHAAFWILIWARKKLYMKNRWDFTHEEKGFFIDPLKGEYYYSNYYNRFEASRQDNLDVIQASVLFLRLLIFARVSNATLANSKEVSRIRSILEDKSQKPALKKKSFYLGIGAEVFRGTVRIGSNMGKAKVIYFEDYKNNDEAFIYIEFVDVKNVLLKVSATRLAEINENSFYTIVWENTRHLLVLIPAFWKLLGFVVTFLTGGAFALIKDIAVDIVISEVAEHIGPSSNMNSAANVGFALFRKGKINPGNLERAVSKGFKNLGEEEAKAAKAMLKLSDDELKAARVAGKITEEELRAIKSAAKYIDDEAKAMKAVDDLALQEAKVANSKSNAINSNAIGSKATANKGIDKNPKMSTADDTVKNTGTNVKLDTGGGIGDLTKKGIPAGTNVNRGVMDWKDVTKMADEAAETSPWVKRVDEIGKITDPASRTEAIKKLANDYPLQRDIEIEIITQRGRFYPQLDKVPCTYNPNTNRILIREDALLQPGEVFMKNLRKAMKNAEKANWSDRMKLPGNFQLQFSAIPTSLRPHVRTVPDAIRFSTGSNPIPMYLATDIARELHRKSRWLQELANISNINSPAERIRQLSKFVDDYNAGSTIKIQFVGPKDSAKLGLTTGNWGTFRPKENVIYMNLGVIKQRNVINEVAHEVGAAELFRVMGITKEMIPRVFNIDPHAKGKFLTHVLDMLIKDP